jgi:hypothetical protein
MARIIQFAIATAIRQEEIFAPLDLISTSGRSAGTAFTRACQALKIEDLHFHDLCHEGTSPLFEAGFAIQQVALLQVTRIG